MREVPMPYGARMVAGTISHEEAEIRHFMEDPEYADLYLQTVLEDGDEREISKILHRYNEAKARTVASLGYWSSLVNEAEQTARDGQNIEVVIGLMTRALNILKAAVPASA